MDITGLSAARAARIDRNFRRAQLLRRLTPAIHAVMGGALGLAGGLAAALLPSLVR